MSLAVRARELKKVYPLPGEEIVALKEIDFEIDDGEFVSIMGPSGAGKTTLLNIIGCLDGLTSGKLEVTGYSLRGVNERKLSNIRRDNIGFVFEEFYLLPTLTALENVQLPLIFANRFRGNNRPKEFLEKVGLSHRMGHFPRELSGGELQRVAVARALVNNPRVLLADEPTGNLDTKNAQALFGLFRNLSQSEALTTLVATHNVKLAYQADRVIRLSDGHIEKDERIK